MSLFLTARLTRWLALSAALVLGTACSLWGAGPESANAAAASAETAAWTAVTNAQAQFRKQVGAAAMEFAAQSRSFAERFPTNENALAARMNVVFTLAQALATGNTACEEELIRFVGASLFEKGVPENDRFMLFDRAINAGVIRKAPLRFLREAKRRYPENQRLYEIMLQVAQLVPKEEQKDLAAELVVSKFAPEKTKQSAASLLADSPFGKPFDMKFTALDGKEIDVSKMKGKVVLIDFWSTRCPPCIMGMPDLKAAYKKFHDRGFELIGISLDEQEEVLKSSIKRLDLPWPHHFEPPPNQFAVRYNIRLTPTMWLIDKSGVLRMENVQGFLDSTIESLLQEN